jgi:hypothetical protein
MIIAFIPAGAILGFLGGLLIEIIVGLIAGTAFSADHPARFSWRFLGSLPGLGALIGAILAPILYARALQADPQTRWPRSVSRLWRMDDSDILARIREMVDAEHELRQEMQENPGEVTDAAQRLHELEESLDQFWDLLRQRRAHREFAQDPNDSRTRPRQQVEGYLQ